MRILVLVPENEKKRLKTEVNWALFKEFFFYTLDFGNYEDPFSRM